MLWKKHRLVTLTLHFTTVLTDHGVPPRDAGDTGCEGDGTLNAIRYDNWTVLMQVPAICCWKIPMIPLPLVSCFVSTQTSQLSPRRLQLSLFSSAAEISLQ
ncbi:hypothetical protein SLE2022_384480 [Rubroshorea leprosula]